MISSTCPAVVSYVEKYYPKLIGYLAPLASPMIAMGRLIKERYKPEAKVVFIGSCVAKKAEINDEKVAGVIDAVLVYAELKEMFAAKGIDPSLEVDSEFSGPKPYLGRLFALPGGLLRAMGIPIDVTEKDFIVAEGEDRVCAILRELDPGNSRAKLLDLLACEGCIGGPLIDSDLSLFRAKEMIIDYMTGNSDPAQTEKDLTMYAGVDLSRRFTVQGIYLPHPTEEEIRDILSQIDKAGPGDELDCGACGYSSCREMAIAIYQGLAEKEMCWPYLVHTLETTQEELLRAEKLTSLGQMAASIAHELNNPLSGVLVYTQLMAKKMASDTLSKEVALSNLSKMESEISRSSRIVRNLLDFARQTEPMLRLLDVNQVLEQAISLVGHQAMLQNVQIMRELDPALPKVMADPDQLQQVFINLSLNAIQAMPEGGKLTLRTTAVSDTKAPSKGPNWIKIDVQDTGCGIPKENLRKLFTPFFTTKGKGKGVGLGLAVVYGIIQRHKGRIEVQSEVGKGTTFTVYLEIQHEKES